MLAIARVRGRITIADAVTLLAANRNTDKLHLRQVVQQGYLEQHGAGKGAWYSVGRLIETVKAADWPHFELSMVSQNYRVPRTTQNSSILVRKRNSNSGDEKRAGNFIKKPPTPFPS